MYIKFKMPSAEDLEPPKGFINYLKNLFRKPINIEVKRANPNFDNLISIVDEWHVEYDTDLNFPIREVGLNDKKEVIMIMPWERNYGFWSDKKINLNQFKQRLYATETSKEDFDSLWNSFEYKERKLYNY